MVHHPAIVLRALDQQRLEGRHGPRAEADAPVVASGPVQLQALQKPGGVDAAVLGAGVGGVPQQVVEPVDVELAVDQAVQAVGPAGSRPVGQHHPDQGAGERAERGVRDAVEDPQPGPLVELDGSVGVAGVVVERGLGRRAEDGRQVACVERLEDVGEGRVPDVVQQTDRTEDQTDPPVEVRPQRAVLDRTGRPGPCPRDRVRVR